MYFLLPLDLRELQAEEWTDWVEMLFLTIWANQIFKHPKQNHTFCYILTL